MRKPILYLFLIWSVSLGYGQVTSEVDSLNEVLLQTHDVTRKVELYAVISKKYHTIDLEEAKSMAIRGLNLAAKSDMYDFNGELYRSLGDIAVKEDSLDLAETYFRKASDHFREQEKYEDLVGAINVLGNIAYVRSHDADAMRHYRNALAIAEEHHLDDIMLHLFTNIGAINANLQNYKDAIENYTRALEGFERLGDSMSIGQIYNNLGASYNDLNDTALAISYYNRSIDIFLEIGHYYGAGMTYLNLANIPQRHGNYEESNKLLYTALDNLRKDDRYYSAPVSTRFARCYLFLGANYMEMQELDSAYKYLQLAYRLARANELLEDLSQTSSILSKLWEMKGNIDSSFHYFKIYHDYYDSLTNEENIKKLAYLDAQFKFEQERLKESEQTRRNYLMMYFIIGILILAVILMILLLLLWRNRVKRSALEHEALRKELELRNKELTTHVMYQVKKNEFILTISKKLQSGIFKLKPENRKMIEDIIRDLEADSADKAWEEFEVRFHRVHSDFNKKLLDRFPDLTANELRLCAFLRLNMNIKEIAAITYQSANSIGTARSRLRQKLGLSKDDSLIGFLNQF